MIDMLAVMDIVESASSDSAFWLGLVIGVVASTMIGVSIVVLRSVWQTMVNRRVNDILNGRR